MQANGVRRRVRLMLGQWGGWMVMLRRLERELAAARDWIARAREPDLLENARRLEGQILAEIENLLRLRGSVSCLMEQLTAEQQRVLILRYERGLSWVQIGIRMNYDERSVRRLETQAVDVLGQGMEGA